MKFLICFVLLLPVLVAAVVIALPLVFVGFLVYQLFELLRFCVRALLVNSRIIIRGYEKRRLGHYDYLDNRDSRESKKLDNKRVSLVNSN